MRHLLLLVALVGAILPMVYFGGWLVENDWDFGGLIEAWNVNDAATGLVYDLLISAIALTVWVLFETVKSGRLLNLIAIPATWCIGVSCGLPLYLWLRMR